MLEDIEFSAIQNENARKLVKILLNQIEQLSANLRDARAVIQQRDEINRLKGEQGKPEIKANIVKIAAKYSSEKERGKPCMRNKKSKKARLIINREEVVYQEILLLTDNVCFRKEKYYSPSQRKTYLAELPAGYAGQFGPGIKALVVPLYFGCQTTELKIVEFLGYAGIQILAGQVSNLLIKKHDEFHAENDSVCEAGLETSPAHNLDDTPTRVNGQNHA